MLRSATKVSLGELGKDRSASNYGPSLSEAHVRGAAARRRYTRRIRSDAFHDSLSALFDDVVSPSRKAWRSVPCQGRLMFRRKKRPQLAKNIIAESEGIIKFGILTGGTAAMS